MIFDTDMKFPTSKTKKKGRRGELEAVEVKTGGGVRDFDTDMTFSDLKNKKGGGKTVEEKKGVGDVTFDADMKRAKRSYPSTITPYTG